MPVITEKLHSHIITYMIRRPHQGEKHTAGFPNYYCNFMRLSSLPSSSLLLKKPVTPGKTEVKDSMLESGIAGTGLYFWREGLRLWESRLVLLVGIHYFPQIPWILGFVLCAFKQCLTIAPVKRRKLYSNFFLSPSSHVLSLGRRWESWNL